MTVNKEKRNTLMRCSKNPENKDGSIFGIISENFNEEPSEHMGSITSSKFYEEDDINIVTSLHNESSAFKNMSKD